MRDIHRLAWELRPAALDDFGLEMALRRYADEWAALSGVPVDFHSQGVTARRLAPELETTLYRITREALTNVFRHAKAKRVSVLLERRAGPRFADCGRRWPGLRCGGDAASVRDAGQIGLVRHAGTGHAGGRLVEIESSPGAGTTVFVRLPLAFEPAVSQPAAASRERHRK